MILMIKCRSFKEIPWIEKPISRHVYAKSTCKGLSPWHGLLLRKNFRPFETHMFAIKTRLVFLLFIPKNQRAHSTHTNTAQHNRNPHPCYTWTLALSSPSFSHLPWTISEAKDRRRRRNAAKSFGLRFGAGRAAGNGGIPPMASLSNPYAAQQHRHRNQFHQPPLLGSCNDGGKTKTQQNPSIKIISFNIFFLSY